MWNLFTTSWRDGSGFGPAGRLRGPACKPAPVLEHHGYGRLAVDRKGGDELFGGLRRNAARQVTQERIGKTLLRDLFDRNPAPGQCGGNRPGDGILSVGRIARTSQLSAVALSRNVSISTD